jgi:predicted NACHT family NTPase
MAASEVLALIKVFKEPLISFFKEATEEVNYFLDKGIKPYVESHLRKIRITNTFLHRTEKVDFYRTFFPLKIKSGRTTIESDDNFVTSLFKAGNCVTIIGQAGSGKTMLTKHIFLLTVKTKIKIPLLIELRFLNDYDGLVIDFIKKTISNNDLAPNEKILERLLNDGNFLFILDGFDEIFSENKQRIVHDLDMFIDKHPNNLYVLTSRPGVSVENLPRFRNFTVNPLEDSQIREFITKQLHGDSNKILVKRIINTINKPENKDYQFFLQNPLLLSMFMLTFNSYPELPRLKSKFYWNVFDTLCTKHDSITKKGGFQHERKSGLQNEELERILMWLSYISLFDRKLIFDAQYFSRKLNEIGEKLTIKFNTNNLIYDLTVSAAIIVIEGLEYRFPHRSMQEYFAALLIKNQAPLNKAKIYFEKFTRLEFFTHVGNENLWGLCL